MHTAPRRPLGGDGNLQHVQVQLLTVLVQSKEMASSEVHFAILYSWCGSDFFMHRTAPRPDHPLASPASSTLCSPGSVHHNSGAQCCVMKIVGHKAMPSRPIYFRSRTAFRLVQVSSRYKLLLEESSVLRGAAAELVSKVLTDAGKEFILHLQVPPCV